MATQVGAQSASASGESSLAQADSLIKVVGGAVAAVTAILGLPVAWIQFRKTRAEIRKLELEAQKLASDAAQVGLSDVGGHRVEITGDRNVVSVLADPRLAAPLLLLMDFVIAYVYLLIVNYALGLIPYLGALVQMATQAVRLLAFVLIFYPVLRTALQVREMMREMVNGES